MQFIFNPCKKKSTITYNLLSNHFSFPEYSNLGCISTIDLTIDKLYVYLIEQLYQPENDTCEK
jgi:hypothetical protein